MDRLGHFDAAEPVVPLVVGPELVGRVRLELGHRRPVGCDLLDHATADIPAAVVVFTQLGDQNRVHRETSGSFSDGNVIRR